MRLKRVRIFGFKTFADRTEFNLDGGIVAVVGPNGCGKSNLVDAILWGLGEGNSRHLRAASNQDVIFSGSSRRKGVGFAEVNLLFDNEDGALPIDSAEVSINRKLNRAGESEYSINRQHCRLRDIYDLLADSGLGRAGYAIVGQKEIDAALSASAEDRRAWVDEAAGVQRYRARKVESLRRLATAQEHLSRVADILRELGAQREPLEAEAEVALRYRNVQGSLKTVEVGLLVKEVAGAVREVAELENRISESVRIAQAEMARADSLEAKSRHTGDEISKIETEMDAIRVIQQGSITSHERAEADLRLAQQRLESLSDQEKTLAEDQQAHLARINEAEAENERLKVEAEAEREALQTMRTTFAGAGDEARQLTENLRAIEKELNTAREEHAKQLKQNAEQQHRKERLALATRELKGVEAGLPELEQAVAEAQTALEEILGAVKELEEGVRAKEAEINQVKVEEDQDAKAVRNSLAEKASLEGRKRGIEATIDSHEGLNQGPRAVVEAAERGILKAKYTPVAEAIEAEKDLALAIETALGGSANDLIVDSQEDAKTAIDWLKQNRAGRATFQPIPLMRPSEVSGEMRRLLGQKGVVGRASELVRCKPSHRPVIDSLLGRIILVEDLDVALGMARTSGWSRLVTLDGEVVHSGGAVTGGVQSRQSYGMVQRKADLAELEADLKKLEQLVDQFDGRSERRRKKREALESQVLELRDEVADKAGEVGEARSFHHTLSDELKSTVRSGEKLQQELESLRRAEVGKVEKIDLPEIEDRRDVALKALAAKSADAELAEERLREAQTRLAQAEQRFAAADRRVAAAKLAEDYRQKKIEHLEPDREKIRQEIEQFGVERERALQQRAEADKRLSEFQIEKRELLENSLRLSEEAKAARANATTVNDAAHQAELNKARADSRRTASLQRLFEEYSLNEQDAIAQENLHEVPPDAQAVVSRLRRELKSMGDVNLGAIEAYERLTLRLEELGAQQEDILQGIDQVEKSIQELDGLTRERFLTTFAAVQIAFGEMFLQLFGGGSGQISLSDSNNVLESGIELQIQLPGKKQQPLNLLSGGERSLCGSAFLFALLKVKPSPLVVLDEVDAPLDGRNVERFAEALKQFTANTQFIVITHNPTTIEAAPVWLGVTMQEPGVSTLVPARMPETKEKIAIESAVVASPLTAPA